MLPDTIFHIATRTEWDNARAGGSYRMSTRGLTLEQVGFIHCSQAGQVATVANAYYADAEDLVLLRIDPTRVTADVRLEDVEGADQPFPHIYGPLDLDAVVSVTPFAAGPDGRFVFPVD